MGYSRAGFDVVGVDIKPQPHYPFEFHQADAMTYPFDGFRAIHASPPCQHYSILTPSQRTKTAHRASHPDLIGVCRERLLASGLPFVIENVSGARRVLRDPIKLCGSSFGLPIERHRYFEVPWMSFSLLPGCQHANLAVVPSGHTNHRVGGVRAKGNTVKQVRSAMDIDWLTGAELSQAIPPAYTEFIGTRLMRIVVVDNSERIANVTTR